jgi:anion-transporting  ArsA/GET3 family ATPase
VLPLLERRVIFVTGKGGVGKTTVATAIATLGLRHKKNVLLVQLNPLASPLDSSSAQAEPQRGRWGFSVVKIDPHQALQELLHDLLRFRFLSRRLLASTTFQVVTAAAPGLEAFLALTRVLNWEKARHLLSGKPVYDLIIVEAPATGHSLSFFKVPTSLLTLAPVGPLADTLKQLSILLADRQKTMLLVVTSPEEMAVNEAVEAYRHLKQNTPIFLFSPILNRAYLPCLSPEEEEAVFSASSADHPLLQTARYHARRCAATAAAASRLEQELAVQPILLPSLFVRKVTRKDVEMLARILAERMMEVQA